MAPGVTRGRNMRSRCQCSMCPAIHINSRSWLRSSSTHEPSDPPLRVVFAIQRMSESGSVKTTLSVLSLNASERKMKTGLTGRPRINGREQTTLARFFEPHTTTVLVLQRGRTQVPDRKMFAFMVTTGALSRERPRIVPVDRALHSSVRRALGRQPRRYDNE